MRNELDADHESKQLYIFDYYNVILFNPVGIPRIRSPFARIVNQLAEALNDNVHLPRFIFMMPGHTPLEYFNYFHYGISKIIATVLGWLIRHINRLVQGQREHLRDLRPGALIHGEPKIIWLKTFNRPYNNPNMSIRPKFNAVLEELLAKYDNNHIMDVEKSLRPANFERNGFLIESGKASFWFEVDRQIKRFDRREDLLIPKPVVSKVLSARKRKNSRDLPGMTHNRRHDRRDTHKY